MHRRGDRVDKSIEKASEILDSLSEGVITIDKKFVITFINSAAESLIGTTRQDAIGKSCKSVCRSELCEADCPITQVIKSGKSIYNFNSRMIAKNKKIIPVVLNAVVLRNNRNEPKAGVLSFHPASRPESLKSVAIPHSFCGIVGKSKAMLDIFQLIRELSRSDASVFIQGETGTGKELIANAVHEHSRRAANAYVKVNCAVIPPQLLASELFGHTKGAFTDAKNDRVGRFELADKGTIFLDEVAEMPTNMQTQLLRILQNGSFERLGDSKTRKVDVRVIAATNMDIQTAIADAQFRNDLFFRLNIIPIHIPPLRERKEDLPFLFEHFIQVFNQRYNRQIEEIDTDALDILLQYDWPGNIREVENVIEYAFIRSKKNHSICICGLPPSLRSHIVCNEERASTGIASMKSEQLVALLDQNNWNQSKVADILGVHRSTVWRKLKSIQS
ncbi:MAG: sigma 54-interacting transcriptional regulator [Candidatus Marinimicrobia bacterium]|nr:sigma 54-interacting transcriptional regulator [FCB group bacterium]MBL7026191.1 sigma 54-interacting transcriptional regulator [Candidatus Neomarinimicrobiota bacterium]